MRENSPEVEPWARRKRRVEFLLASLVTALFFALVTAMAFAPRLLARTVYQETVSVGVAAAFAFLLLTFLAMGGYVVWRERRDPLER